MADARHWLRTRPPVAPTSKGQRAALDALLFSLASIGAVAAYTFQPLQRFAPPEGLLTGGILLVFGLAPLVVARHIRTGASLAWMALPLIWMAFAILLVTARDAFQRSDWNDRRCWRIQQAMLRPSATTRADLPELFTALACPAQGSAPIDVHYPQSRSERHNPAAVAAHEIFLQKAIEAEVQVDTPPATHASRHDPTH